jgi:hypothetical protein
LVLSLRLQLLLLLLLLQSSGCRKRRAHLQDLLVLRYLPWLQQALSNAQTTAQYLLPCLLLQEVLVLKQCRNQSVYQLRCLLCVLPLPQLLLLVDLAVNTTRNTGSCNQEARLSLA